MAIVAQGCHRGIGLALLWAAAMLLVACGPGAPAERGPAGPTPSPTEPAPTPTPSPTPASQLAAPGSPCDSFESAGAGASPLRPGQCAIVDTPEQATALAGYKVGVPSYIPEKFQRGIKIEVKQPTRGRLLPQIRQTWVYQDNHDIGFWLEQVPGMGGLGDDGAEPATFGPLQGYRAVLPAIPNEGPRANDWVVLFWGVDEGGAKYVLTGTMAPPLTEEELVRIAASIG